MFFLKITDRSNVTRIINLESVTLCGIRTVMTNGVNQELCEVTYHMGGGTFSTFLLDCTLDQFLDYIQYVFNCPGNPHALLNHLLTKRPPNEWKVGDTVRVTDPCHPCHRELGTLLEKTDYPWVVRSHKRADSVHYLASDQLEFVQSDTTPVKKSDIETLGRMIDRKFFQELLTELPQPSPTFDPWQEVKIIDAQHSQFGCVGAVLPVSTSQLPPNFVVVRIDEKNTHHDYTLRKDQIQLHIPQEPNSCNGNGKAQSTGE